MNTQINYTASDNKKKYDKEYGKLYRKNHKQQSKEYRETHKEQSREYRENNKTRISELSKQYIEKNKEVIIEQRKVKITCVVCGSIITKKNILQHNKSKKHLKHIN